MERAYPPKTAATGAFYGTFLVIGDNGRNCKKELKGQ
jgi:hypothetical protein